MTAKLKFWNEMLEEALKGAWAYDNGTAHGKGPDIKVYIRTR
jgi:hypothetical protein